MKNITKGQSNLPKVEEGELKKIIDLIVKKYPYKDSKELFKSELEYLIQKSKEEVIEIVKKLKLPIQPKYDGNNLEEACLRYGIGATDWCEILRYEDGYNQALNDVLRKLQMLKEK